MKFLLPIKLLLVFGTLPFTLFSQDIDVSILTIPKELKENANAIIRLNETVVSIESNSRLITHVNRIVTVLNKLGNRDINAELYYDDNTSVKSIEAVIYDRFGKKIKKIKSSKFQDVSATYGSTLASDGRIKYLDYTPSSYPYTVVFKYETSSNTTGFIRNWFPIEGYSVSIEKSTYSFKNKKNYFIRTKEMNFKGFEINKTKNQNTLQYSLENQPAYKYEKYAPSISKLFPKVMFGLNQFSLMGIEGEATNWKEFGKWQYEVLIKEKDNLSEETKTKIRELTSEISDTLKKAEFIYEYVQDKTRYISIQYGIGGLSPAYSNEVDQLSYGDCKGLTNYTKSLLDAVGITSYYTEIYAKSNKRNIEKDFHSIQGNHIILNLPYQGKDYWLECTSKTLPFGFLGDFTDDRDALVITPEGGIIKHTPTYINDYNHKNSISHIKINTDGSINSDVSINTTGTQYDQHYQIENYNSKEILDYYTSKYWKKINNLTITDYSFENNETKVLFSEKINVVINNYASLTGDNLLITTNVFNQFSNLPPRQRSRKLPIEVQRGFLNTDTNHFTIPTEFQLSNLPDKKLLENEFGTYEVSFEKIDEQHFTYHRKLLIKAGLYPKESYEAYRSFLKAITKHDNLRIAIIKK